VERQRQPEPDLAKVEPGVGPSSSPTSPAGPCWRTPCVRRARFATAWCWFCRRAIWDRWTAPTGVLVVSGGAIRAQSVRAGLTAVPERGRCHCCNRRRVSVAMKKSPLVGGFTRSSCRSGTAGPGGDGEGANHAPPPPGSSIEVCEGPYGHHFCLSTSRVVSGSRAVVRQHPQDRQTGRGVVRGRRPAATLGRGGPQLRRSDRPGRRAGRQVSGPNFGEAAAADRAGSRLRRLGA
jgi:hypothetical protein